MWLPKRADLSFHVLSFNWSFLGMCRLLFKDSSRNDSERLHPTLLLPVVFCLGEPPVLRNSALLIKCLIHRLFCLPSFHLHMHKVDDESNEWIHGGRIASGVLSVLYLLVLLLSLDLFDDRISFATTMLDLTTFLEEKNKQVRDSSYILENTIKRRTIWIWRLILKFVLIYLKDASNVLLFVLADSSNGPLTLVLGFSELWTNETAALKQEHNPANVSGN